MSTKELVIELRIPLPDGLFEESAVINKTQYAIEALKENMNREVGEGHYSLDVTTATKRGPRGNGVAAEANGAAAPRSRRSASTEQAAAA